MPTYARSFLLFTLAFCVLLPIHVSAQPTRAALVNNPLKDLNRLLKEVEISESAGRMDESIKLYERILVIDPANPIIYNNLGTHYVSKKRFQKAAFLFESAVKLKPEFALASFNLSIVYFHLNRPQKALSAALLAAKHDT